MIPSNVDPRRPDKVQRYKPTQPNGNAPGDDLTPDYMNILGSESPATANADAPTESTTEEQRPAQDSEGAAAISVLPVSPQYGIATLPPASIETLSETSTLTTDTVTETTAKNSDADSKDLHSTPSRNDRFKVVKIASLEPFRRGRWKCMDYVDQTAPPSSTASKTQNAPLYMHTQSLPQQHFQQLLVQGGYANPQYFQNVPAQMIPQNQYFYPAPQNMQTQNLQQQMGIPPNSVYISASGQQFIQQSVVPNSIGGFTVQTYPNLYVPAQNQNSAFIPTSQNVNAQNVNAQIPSNFQQSQTYAGQPSVSQQNITQPVVNGHVYAPNQSNEPVATSLPTQAGKTAILTTQPQTIQSQVPQSISLPNNQSSQMQNVPVQAVLPTQQYSQIQQQNAQNFQPQLVQQMNQNNGINQLATIAQANQLNPTQAATIAQVNQLNPTQSATNVPQMINIPTNVYANPQFVTAVNNAPVSDQNREPENADLASGEPTEGERGNNDDLARANPVVNPVNAIDNKIEQAMDLVKSHLMYTVREEVEVLKEKITELMEKIQQLETENNYLRSQLPKSQSVNPNGTPDPPQ